MNKPHSSLLALPFLLLALAACATPQKENPASSTLTSSSKETTSAEPRVSYSASFSEGTVTYFTLTYFLSVTSSDAVVLQKAYLKDAAGTLAATDEGCQAKKFSGLKAATSYTFFADFTVGGVASTFQYSKSVSTLPIGAPIISFVTSAITSSSLEGTIKVEDPTESYTPISLMLKIRDTVKETTTDPAKMASFQFKGLSAETKYTLSLDYDYTLSGEKKEIIRSEDFTTLAA